MVNMVELSSTNFVFANDESRVRTESVKNASHFNSDVTRSDNNRPSVGRIEKYTAY